MIINAENAVLGRLASYTAKQVLQGKEVIIVNSEKAIIVGNEKNIVDHYLENKARGGSGLMGPFVHSGSEKILKRTIRNMLPYTKERGIKALKRVKCYIGIPKEYEDKKMIKSGKGRKGISLERISKMLRGGK
tara:strand:- start:399 stop:797 length:399 start_codon:yes stop_codon:yes gene_type:complete